MNNESKRPTASVTPAQVAVVKRLFVGGTFGRKPVDRAVGKANVAAMKLRHLRTKLSRINLTKADREVAALKDQFRKEDLALASEGRHEEIALRNRRLMGLKDGARTRLVGFGGVRFE